MSKFFTDIQLDIIVNYICPYLDANGTFSLKHTNKSLSSLKNKRIKKLEATIEMVKKFYMFLETFPNLARIKFIDRTYMTAPSIRYERISDTVSITSDSFFPPKMKIDVNYILSSINIVNVLSISQIPLPKEQCLQKQWGLTSLTLSHCVYLSPIFLQSLKEFKGFCSLKIIWDYNVCDKCLNIFSDISSLKHLTLQFCKKITLEE